MEGSSKLGENYIVLVWKKGKTFYGRIRELGIFESANDFSSLWFKIDKRKQEIIQRFNEAGIQGEIPQPLPSLRYIEGQPSRHVLKNSIYIGSVVLACLLILGIVVWSAGKRVSGKLESLSVKHMVFQQVQGLASRLNSFSDTEQEILHESLQTISEKGRPFVKDINPLIKEIFSDTCSGSQKKTLLPAELSKENVNDG